MGTVEASLSVVCWSLVCWKVEVAAAYFGFVEVSPMEHWIVVVVVKVVWSVGSDEAVAFVIVWHLFSGSMFAEFLASSD